MLLGVVYTQETHLKETTGRDVQELLDISRDWTDESGGAISLSNLSELKDTNKDGVLTIYYELPDDLIENQYMMFLSSNVYLKAYLRGTLIYECKPETIYIGGKSYGTTYNSISIPETEAGQRLRLEITNIYGDSGSIRNIYLGKENEFLTDYFKTYLVSFLAGIVIIMIGVIFAIFALALPQDRDLQWGLIAFSVSSVLFGLWTTEETHILAVLLGHSEIWHMLDYPILVIFPFPIVLATNWTLEKPMKVYTDISAALVGMDVVFLSASRYFTGADPHDNRTMVHGVLVISFLLISFMLVNDFIRNKTKEKMDSRLVMMLGYLIMVVCMVGDLRRYYGMHGTSFDSAVMVRVGYLIFEFLIFYKFVVTVVHNMKTHGEMEMYRKMAFQDGLTQIANRAAYLNHEDDLRRQIREGDDTDIVICSVDLNFLKKMNDTYGHAIGDLYIRTAAKILSESFQDLGQVFRVGGDEFAVFVEGKGAEARTQRGLTKLEQKIAEENLKMDLPSGISMAYGHAMVTEHSAKAIEHVEAAADEKMYEMKKRMKGGRE